MIENFVIGGIAAYVGHEWGKGPAMILLIGGIAGVATGIAVGAIARAALNTRS